MSMTHVIALVACSWATPGLNPYTGTVEDALYAFPIPQQHRIILADKIHRKEATDVVAITKYGIEGGTYRYANDMWMFFGKNTLCYGVDRKGWNGSHSERAMVYCSSGWCVAQPDVCGNLSFVWRRYAPPPEVPYGTHRGDDDPQGTPTVYTVPEPSTALLLLPALLWLGRKHRRTDA